MDVNHVNVCRHNIQRLSGEGQLLKSELVLSHYTRIGKVSYLCLFEALQQIFSHFGTASCVLPVLSNGDELSCSRT